MINPTNTGTAPAARPRTLTRRRFLIGLGALSGGAVLLAACGGATSTATSAPAATVASASSAAPSVSTAASTAPSTAIATTAAAATASRPASTTVATGAAATTTRATASAASGSAAEVTARVVAAANTFLGTLSATEKGQVLFDWGNTTQKQRWSNFPSGAFQRAGLMWGLLSAPAQNAWLAVLQAALSIEGYNRVYAEWHADDAQAVVEASGGGTGPGAGGAARTPGAGGTPGAGRTPQAGGTGGTPAAGGLGGTPLVPGAPTSPSFGSQYYFLALIGTPSTTSPWQLQFGGHHVTVNATIVGPNISMTPSFIGVQPGEYTANGQTIRPLADIATDAFALIGALDATQQKAAVRGTVSIDLVLGPGQDGKMIQPEGLPGAQMNATQQAAFLKLIGRYTGLANDAYTASRNAEIQANLAQTYLAWYGPTTAGSAAYFRVTGPTIVIEYSAQAGTSGADPLHIHGMYRDPTNDYGAKIAK